jgi:hypothetical protein
MKMTLVKKSGGLGHLSARDVPEDKALWLCRTALSKAPLDSLLGERQGRPARHGLRQVGRDRGIVRPGRKRGRVDALPLGHSEVPPMGFRVFLRSAY